MRWIEVYGKVGWDLDLNDYRYRYAIGAFAKIASLLSSTDILASRYGIRAVGHADGRTSSAFTFLQTSQIDGQKSYSQTSRFFFSSEKSILSPLSSLDTTSQVSSLLSLRPPPKKKEKKSLELPAPNPDDEGVQIPENPAVLECGDVLPELGQEIIRP